ncbi:hypothetical protein ACGFZP_12635 [Kitasatospora sp. NPDC048239]|uniref:hypothetical protein n=1 Tax=Kitasatospora sp. NPDC048239 TaxID=3364046 RepID=UPI00371C0C21
MTGRPSVRRAVAGALLAVLVPLAGCSSSSSAPADKDPDAVVTLPAEGDAEAVGGGRLPPFDPSDVQLVVGGSVGVSLRSAPLPHGWELAGSGDTAVVRRGADVALTTCPPDSAGCGHTVRQVWTATAAGSTTLTWNYVDRASCRQTGGSSSCKVLAVKEVRVRVG